MASTSTRTSCDRGHEPAGRPRPRAAAAGALRPPGDAGPRTPRAARAILDLHTRGKPLASDVDLTRLAHHTLGPHRGRAGEPGQRGRDPGRAPRAARGRPPGVRRGARPRRGRPAPQEPRAEPAGEANHRLPRGRPRAGGPLLAARRSRAEDLHRLARPDGRLYAAAARGGPQPLVEVRVRGRRWPVRWAATWPRASSLAK